MVFEILSRVTASFGASLRSLVLSDETSKLELVPSCSCCDFHVGDTDCRSSPDFLFRDKSICTLIESLQTHSAVPICSFRIQGFPFSSIEPQSPLVASGKSHRS